MGGEWEERQKKITGNGTKKAMANYKGKRQSGDEGKRQGGGNKGGWTMIYANRKTTLPRTWPLWTLAKAASYCSS